MNIGFGMNPAMFARPANGPSQAQLNQQVSTGGGSSTARDKMVNDKRRDRSLRMIGGARATQKVALAAAKISGPKKG